MTHANDLLDLLKEKVRKSQLKSGGAVFTEDATLSSILSIDKDFNKAVKKLEAEGFTVKEKSDSHGYYTISISLEPPQIGEVEFNKK